jgi:hypothetical protein
MDVKNHLDKIKDVLNLLKNLDVNKIESVIDILLSEITKSTDITWFIQNYKSFLENENDSIVCMGLFKKISLFSMV